MSTAAPVTPPLQVSSRAQGECVDSHIHFFRRGLPVVDSPRYLPGYDAEVDSYLALCAAHGITRAVVVQPSFYGSDNSFMCSILRARPDVFRGIAVVAPDAPVDLLDRLADDGVVGIRLNLDGQPLPDFATGSWPYLLQQVQQRGWQVELHRDAVDLPRLVGPLVDAGIRVVVDHFGRPSAQQGAGDPGFRYLLQCAGSGQVWVKLSAAYRNGPDGPAQAARLAGELLQHFGAGRLVWGSDWPHTRHEERTSIAASLQALEQWVPDAQARSRVLGATALDLFRFTTPAAAS